MKPSARLKEIEGQLEFGPTQDNVVWLFNRVKRLTEALEFYADVFSVPMQVTAHQEKDKKFEEISTQLLNQFHTVAREALEGEE